MSLWPVVPYNLNLGVAVSVNHDCHPVHVLQIQPGWQGGEEHEAHPGRVPGQLSGRCPRRFHDRLPFNPAANANPPTGCWATGSHHVSPTAQWQCAAPAAVEWRWGVGQPDPAADAVSVFDADFAGASLFDPRHIRQRNCYLQMWFWQEMDTSHKLWLGWKSECLYVHKCLWFIKDKPKWRF